MIQTCLAMAQLKDLPDERKARGKDSVRSQRWVVGMRGLGARPSTRDAGASVSVR